MTIYGIEEEYSAPYTDPSIYVHETMYYNREDAEKAIKALEKCKGNRTTYEIREFEIE